MKSKTFKYGNYTFKSYFKKVGLGYEVGFTFGTKTIFVGNFLYPQEATRWYGIMNREISRFGRQFTGNYKFPINYITQFCGNHLYSTYYMFLDKLFTQYTRNYKRAYQRDCRRFNQMKSKPTFRSTKANYLKLVA